MKKPLLTLSLLMLNVCSWAFEPHSVNYQLSINGIKIAEEVRTLHQLEGYYFYTANAKTTGLAALVKDYAIAASSSFKINEQGVDSINYQILEQEDKKISKNYAVDINSNGQSVVSVLTKSQPKVVTWKSTAGNILDPLSVFLALSFDLNKNPKKTDFFYQVADGKSIEKMHFVKTPDQSISINNQQLKVVKIRRVEHEGDFEIYLIANQQYLPILIKQAKNGRSYTYKITNFKPEDVKNLQVGF